MKQIGSQLRERIEDTGNTILHRSEGEVFIRNERGGEELWVPNDHFAGYVLVIDGIGHEFVTQYKQDEE